MSNYNSNHHNVIVFEEFIDFIFFTNEKTICFESFYFVIL